MIFRSALILTQAHTNAESLSYQIPIVHWIYFVIVFMCVSLTATVTSTNFTTPHIHKMELFTDVRNARMCVVNVLRFVCV